MSNNYEFHESKGSLNFNLAAKAANFYQRSWSCFFREIRNEVAKFPIKK